MKRRNLLPGSAAILFNAPVANFNIAALVPRQDATLPWRSRAVLPYKPQDELRYAMTWG